MVTILCKHCGNEKNADYLPEDYKGTSFCMRCHEYTWIKIEKGKVTSSGEVFSICPGKCKIGKLGLEVKERLDTRLIWGVTYREIIEEFPEAQLNLANISTHKSKHTRPYFRAVMV